MQCYSRLDIKVVNYLRWACKGAVKSVLVVFIPYYSSYTRSEDLFQFSHRY